MAWRKPKNAHEWLRIVLGHKKKFFFPAVSVMIVVIVASLWLPREYTAQAVIEQAKDTTLQKMGSSMIDRNLDQLRARFQRHIVGRAAIEQLIEDLGENQGLPHTEDGLLTPEGQMAKNDMILDYQKRIRTYLRRRDPDEIVVQYTHPDREKVARVVNRLVETYVLKAREELDASIRAPQSFFDTRVAEWDREERKWSKAKLDFEAVHPAQFFKDRAAAENRLEELKDQRKALDNELALFKAKLSAQEDWIEDQPEEIVKVRTGPNPEVLEILEKRKLIEAELENDLYVLNRTEEHPSVKRTRKRLAELEQELSVLDEQVPQGEDREPNIARLEAQREIELLRGHIKAREEERAGLVSDIEETDALKRNFFAKRSEYQHIERKLADASSQLKKYKNELHETLIAAEIEKGQRGIRLNIEERAEEPSRPSEPTIFMILVGSIFLGGGLGGVLVVLAELLNNSLRSIDQAVDDLKLPVLGAVNEIVSPSDIFRAKIFGRGVYPVLATVMTVGLLLSLYLAEKSLSDPNGYEKIMNNPRQYLEQKLFG